MSAARQKLQALGTQDEQRSQKLTSQEPGEFNGSSSTHKRVFSWRRRRSEQQLNIQRRFGFRSCSRSVISSFDQAASSSSRRRRRMLLSTRRRRVQSKALPSRRQQQQLGRDKVFFLWIKWVLPQKKVATAGERRGPNNNKVFRSILDRLSSEKHRQQRGVERQ